MSDIPNIIHAQTLRWTKTWERFRNVLDYVKKEEQKKKDKK